MTHINSNYNGESNTHHTTTTQVQYTKQQHATDTQQQQQPPEGEQMVMHLQDTRVGVDEKLGAAEIQLFADGPVLKGGDLGGRGGVGVHATPSSEEEEEEGSEEEGSGGVLGGRASVERVMDGGSGRLRRRVVFENAVVDDVGEDESDDDEDGDDVEVDDEGEEEEEGMGAAAKWKTGV